MINLKTLLETITKEFCEIKAVKSSGPGGQHANKTSNAVMVTHKKTNCKASCQDFRDKESNIKRAFSKLKIEIAITHYNEMKPDNTYKIYTRNKKIAINAKNKDYPIVIASILKSINDNKGILSNAASELEISTNQLTKIICENKKIKQSADSIRTKNELPIIKFR